MNIHKKVFLALIALLASTNTIIYAAEADAAPVVKKTVKKASPHSTRTRKTTTKKKPATKKTTHKKRTSIESKAAPKTRKPRAKRAAPKKTNTSTTASVREASAKKSSVKKAPTRSPKVTPIPAASAPKKRAPRKAAHATTKAASTIGWPLPIRVKDLPGLSTQASHTHTYSSIAQRIADSGERTNAQLKEVLRDTARGHAPDAQMLSGIAANYHNLGNFVEALSTSSPDTVNRIMLETPNLKPLAHHKR